MCVSIEYIYSRHNEWIKIAVYCGASQDEAQDIVQDMYLKLCLKASTEGDLCSITNDAGDVNSIYIFAMINNAHTSLRRKQKEQTLIVNLHDKEEQESNTDEHEFHHLLQSIYDTLQELHWYDRELFLFYIRSGKSIRQLAAKTGISRTSINNTIQNVKQIIREKHGEEVEKIYGKTEKKACKPSKKSRTRRYD
jgi:RNA polymerase sigma factor (sigma-70 family)